MVVGTICLGYLPAKLISLFGLEMPLIFGFVLFRPAHTSHIQNTKLGLKASVGYGFRGQVFTDTYYFMDETQAAVAVVPLYLLRHLFCNKTALFYSKI